MQLNRTTPIYGNCQVFSPDGELMFRCLEKRARWYLNRNLAILLNEDPLSIKLNFLPKGNGQRQEELLVERENRCIVCGEDDLSSLTRHHLVPYEYRKFFPDAKKNHNSIYVVPICRECHSSYEHNHAIKLKEIYASRYFAPMNQVNSPLKKAAKVVHCLLKNSQQLPLEKLHAMKQKAFELLTEMKLIKSLSEVDDQQTLQNIHVYLNAEMVSEKWHHGKIVLDKITDLESLEKEWVNNFMDTMQPKFMSVNLKALFATIVGCTIV